MNNFGNEPNYPVHMHHAILPPVQVTSKEDRAQRMKEGFTDHYQHQEWPKTVYHAEQEPRTVANPGEMQLAIDEGWTADFEHVLSDPSNPNSLKLARSPKPPAPPAKAKRADKE